MQVVLQNCLIQLQKPMGNQVNIIINGAGRGRDGAAQPHCGAAPGSGEVEDVHGAAVETTYEFYHPMSSARQLGMDQLPIGLFFADKIQRFVKTIKYQSILADYKNL
jgi:hypothetical protein